MKLRKCKDYVCNIQEECEKCNLVGLMIDADTFQIPFVQTVYSFVYFYFVMPSQVMQFGHIRQFAQCAVRFRCIPSQLTFESYFSYNLFSRFLYAEFLPVPTLMWQLRISLLSGAYVSLKSTFSSTCTLASAISSLHRNSRNVCRFPTR